MAALSCIGNSQQFSCLQFTGLPEYAVSHLVGLTLLFIVVSAANLAEGTPARAADRVATKPADESPALLVSQQTPWSNSANYLRPHKGVRFAQGRNAGPMLLWVLCSPNGQPLAVSPIDEAKVDDYFRSRLAAKLAEVSKERILRPEQIDKLTLAAQVDLARLRRLAQRTDEELAKSANDSDGANERKINTMLHSLSVACDQELFAEKSLFNRVLAKQLVGEPAKDN